MSVSAPSDFEGLLDQLKTLPASDRLRMARMILETLETGVSEPPQRPRPFSDLVGLLKTDAPPPTDEECQEFLEEELMKKHLR